MSDGMAHPEGSLDSSAAIESDRSRMSDEDPESDGSLTVDVGQQSDGTFRFRYNSTIPATPYS